MNLRNVLMIPAMHVLGPAAMPAAADVRIDVDVGAHAPLRQQWVSPPRNDPGWVPGYWTFDHGYRVWHEGYWVEVNRDRRRFADHRHYGLQPYPDRDGRHEWHRRVGPDGRDSYFGWRDDNRAHDNDGYRR